MEFIARGSNGNSRKVHTLKCFNVFASWRETYSFATKELCVHHQRSGRDADASQALPGRDGDA